MVSVAGRTVSVTGAKGTLHQELPPGVSLTVAGEQASVVRNDDSKESAALQGLSQRLVSNMVRGVSAGFQKKLEIVGVGYRADVRGETIFMTLGYSHPILFQLPTGVRATVDRQTSLTLESTDAQLLGQTAAMVRALRPPEPYKGKGIKYADEVIKRKSGKAAGSA